MKFLLFLHIVFLSSCCSTKPMEIIQFYPYKTIIDSSMDNGKLITGRDDFFLIKNYCDKKSTPIYLDSFVAINRNSEYLKLSYYSMSFFKETSKTNLEAIQRNPREIDRYSNDHDLVYTYTWRYGKYDGRRKIIDGEDVELKKSKIKITIEPMPDSLKK